LKNKLHNFGEAGRQNLVNHLQATESLARALVVLLKAILQGPQDLALHLFQRDPDAEVGHVQMALPK
jgi:hypothetical protein